MDHLANELLEAVMSSLDEDALHVFGSTSTGYRACSLHRLRRLKGWHAHDELLVQDFLTASKHSCPDGTISFESTNTKMPTMQGPFVSDATWNARLDEPFLYFTTVRIKSTGIPEIMVYHATIRRLLKSIRESLGTLPFHASFYHYNAKEFGRTLHLWQADWEIE